MIAFSLFLWLCLFAISSACSWPNLCITPEKTLYTEKDEWIDLKCVEWNADTRVRFEVLLDEETKVTALLFDSGRANPIPEEYKNLIRVNPTKDGILYSVKNNREGTKPIYCYRDQGRSLPIQLNYVSGLKLVVSPSKFQPKVKAHCEFEMRPKSSYSITVSYYMGQKYMGAITETNNTLGLASGGTNFQNSIVDGNGIYISGRYNEQYEVTLQQMGKWPTSQFHCRVSSQTTAEEYKSPAIQIASANADDSGNPANPGNPGENPGNGNPGENPGNGNPGENPGTGNDPGNSASFVTLSLFSTLFSMAIVALNR